MSSMPARAKCAFRSIRCGRRRRSTRSASTTTRRCRTGATAPTISTARSRTSIYDRDYLAGNLRGGEGYDWYLCRRRGARRARRARRSPTASASRGCSAPRISGTCGRNPHYERVGGAELASPTAWVPQSKPIWLTEVGCPAVDKGANQPSVFPDPKSSEGGVSVFLQRPARRSDPAPLSSRRCLRRSIRRSARRERATRCRRVYGGRMVDPSGHPSVDLGRAALSGVSGRHRRLERRRQLGDRPLAHRPARLARRSTRWSPRSSTDAGIDGLRCRGARRGARRLCDRPADVAARGDRAARARLCVRRGRGGRRARVPSARRRAGRRAWRGRSGAAGRRRAVAPDARAGNRTAARGLARLHRRRRRLSPRCGRARAAWSAARRGPRTPISPSSPTTRGRAARRNLAAGSVGRARERRVRAAAEPARAHAGRRDRARRSSGRRRLLEIARDRRHRAPRDQGALDRSGGVRPAAGAAAPAARRRLPPPLGPVHALAARPADARAPTSRRC